MASPINAALCALLATAFWSLCGYAIGRRLLPRALAAGAAPVIGWAVQSVVTLPLFELIGFSSPAVVTVALLSALAAGLSLRTRAFDDDKDPGPTLPACAFLAAAVLAIMPAIAIVPKVSAAAAQVADPIYDHSKIAIIDAMVRQGLPPVDPVFGTAAAPGHLVYYYLLHYSAAELALPLHVSGWTADIALTWFTAFASLSLMMGLAVWLSKRPAAAMVAVLLAAAASVRLLISRVFSVDYAFAPFLAWPTGFANWLFQTTWAPQHVMSASCAVAAMLLVVRSAECRSRLLPGVLGLIVAAGFESSAYVGGITFGLAALVAAPLLLAGMDAGKRVRFMAGLAAAAALALCVAAPFVIDQFAALAARGSGNPVFVRHFEVLGDLFPPTWRRVLDVPAYWIVLLPLEFPVAAVAGTLALAALLRGAAARPEKLAVTALACLAGAGACASWLLASRIGSNNDLALRAIVPAATILTAAAAAGVMLVPRRRLIVAAAFGGLALTLPETAVMLRADIVGTPAPDGNVFAQAPELWQAVRRYAPPAARVANNPLYLQDLTPWPVNLSWALLADRSSCFAGKELALAFAPLPQARREAIDAQFVRVFAGQGTAADVADMAHVYGCDVVVVVPQDGAWSNDPFAASPDYRLAESRDNRWRIYLLRL
jgi:hypothetical protein